MERKGKERARAGKGESPGLLSRSAPLNTQFEVTGQAAPGQGWELSHTSVSALPRGHALR